LQKRSVRAIGAVFLVIIMLVGFVGPIARIPKAEAAPQLEINDAVTKGLNYLNSTQAPDGSWGASFAPVASTAMAVLAFENANHTADNMTDPYHTEVAKGLDYLFTQAHVEVLTNKSAGNPDVSGDGLGIYFYSYDVGSPHYTDSVYQTPMVLIAIVASGNQSRIATTGPVNVTGLSYYHIVQDIVSWIAWAQNDNTTGVYEGGWRYKENYGSSDNSVTQWPILGLLTAELWGISGPSWVQIESAKWLSYSQNLGGDFNSNYYYGAFGYTDPYTFDSIAETAAGILGLTYCGVPENDSRIMAAEGYIVRDWLVTSGWQVNFGWFYAMYAVMKTCRLATPAPIDFIENYTGFPTIDWFNGTGEYADYLLANQGNDGSWVQSSAAPEDVSTDLSTSWGVLILEYVPVRVTYNLTVNVIDADTSSPISGATVIAVGPENLSGVTDGGLVVFNEAQAGSYLVSVSKTAYTAVNQPVDLTEDQDITIELAKSGPFELNVSVVNSGGLPISNALVEAANTTVYSDSSGIASFVLPRGSYNVTASYQDYQPSSWSVDLNTDKNITLTLGYPYVFIGEIPDSNIILTPIDTGYNLTLLNGFDYSLDVFIEWHNVGTIPAETWQTFSYDHLPNLIVEAASKGSSDYPHAWYKYQLPIPLVPTTGQEGAFLQETVPFAAGSIFVTPYPPVYGENTTIGVTLHDPFDYILNISRIDFQISNLNIGGDAWASIGYLSNITLQPNETNIFSIIWLATVSGHHCVRVVLTYSPESQTLQRNMDIEYDVLQGKAGEAEFTLTNPYQTAKTITLKVSQNLPPNWQTELQINGAEYGTSSDINFNLAAGGELPVTLVIASNSANSGQADVDVQGYIDGQLIGGVHKTMQTVPITYPQYLGYHLASYPDGTYIPGQTANFGETYEIVVKINNPDVVSHEYTIDLAQNGVSTPIGAIAWNWPSWLKPVMEILGVPTQWNTNPQWVGTTSTTENVAPGHNADFIFTVSCKWNWIPPWDWKYLLSTILWINNGLSVPNAILNLISWTQPLGLLDQLQGIGSFVRNEQFDFHVSFGSTILGAGGASVTLPLISTKVLEYIDSVVATLPAGELTFGAIATALTGVGIPIAVAGALGQAALIAAQNILYAYAADPSSDYTQVVQPVPPTLLNGTAILELPAVKSLTGSTYNFIQTFVGFLEYQNATTISIERYTEATAANDSYYENLQLQTLVTYASQCDQLLTAVENQLPTLSPLLPPLNSSTIESAETYLSQNGLPDVEQQLLTGLGLSSSIPGITAGMQALLNATLLNETLLSQFSLINGIQVMQSLLTTETNSWKQQLSSTTYLITFDQTGVGSDFNGTVVTVDGTSYSASGLPVSFQWDEGSIHSFSFASPLNVNFSRGYCWWSTSGLSNLKNDTLTVTASGNVTATFGLIGDLNHDGTVSLTDLVMFANAWHSHPGDQNWNPECDIAAPYGVISLPDFVTLAMHYGQH